ncbi:MAG TPA: RNA methyltransferase [Bacteroidia bacterium]|nr:RNA methyltransferase [Bacteroidia bacterium]
MNLKLPADFIRQMQSVLGASLPSFLNSIQGPSPVSLRINPFKSIADFDDCERVPWSDNAFYLKERISFTMDPLFHAGCYYVQEASSMYLEQLFRYNFPSGQPIRVLDLCAAPGGKSTHLLSILPEGSLMVSNELVPSRNGILKYNIDKWGVANVVVTQNQPEEIGKLKGFFDLILVDAPCSGEGLFRKDPDAVGHWSIENVNQCALRQSNILDAVYPALKQNGVLVYSTCTYEPSENEMQADRMAKQYNMTAAFPLHPGNGIAPGKYGLQFFPHLTQGEGFFITALRKQEDQSETAIKSLKQKRIASVFIDAFLNNSDAFIPVSKGDELYALPDHLYEDMHFLMSHLYIRKAGCHIGTLKGKDLVPSHELSLSIHLSKNIPSIELNREEAITYLKCGTLKLPQHDNGWAIVKFRGYTLGWVKIIGSRVNNYFPKSQRIVKQ